MLKHEDNPEPQPPSAAEARATPEELAAAITRLEARKDASQRQSEGTVAIGEVVQQLGLDATPEEVFAEVQTERTRLSGTRKRRLSLRERLGLWLVTGVLTLSVTTYSLNIANSQNAPSSAVAVVPTSVSTDISPHSIQIDQDHLQVTDTSGKLLLLSEVGDNQPVLCGYSPLLSTFSSYTLSFSNDHWTLIKHGGRVYVRGWILRMSAKVMERDGIDVSAHAGDSFTVPITLPLSGFQVLRNVGSYVEFHALKVHVDNHAYEKW